MEMPDFITDLTSVLVLPFDIVRSTLLAALVGLTIVFAWRVALPLFFLLCVAGFFGWFVWFSLFVFEHPTGVESHNFEVAGFSYSAGADELLEREPSLAGMERAERNSVLLTAAGNNPSQVWTGESLFWSRLAGFFTTAAFSVGLVGLAQKTLVRTGAMRASKTKLPNPPGSTD